MPKVTAYKVDTLEGVRPDSIVALKVPNKDKFELFVTSRYGVPFPLEVDGDFVTHLKNTDGNLTISGTQEAVINISTTLLNTINSALKAGDSISSLLNDAGYLVASDLPSPYTNENAQDAVGSILTDTTTIDLSYNDGLNTISADVKANSISATQLADNINISEFVNDSGYLPTTTAASTYETIANVALKENTADKTTNIVADQASNIKFPSAKTVFDWATSTFTTTSAVATQITTALVGYATQSWATSQGYITNVITALGYTPANRAGETFTGAISATNLSGTNTGNETTTTLGTLINSAGNAVPNDTDFVATAEAGGLLKKISWANVKVFLKPYLISDTPYNSGSWDGVTDVAPSKNAVRDVLESKQDKITGLTTNFIPKVNGSGGFSNSKFIELNGNIGLGSATTPGELLHIGDGNMLLEGGGEVAQKFKRDFTTTGINLGVPTGSGQSVNPIFQIGRIIQAGDGDPEIRVMYSDDNTSERTVFEVDRKGIVASVKTGLGSHFEGFASLTDVNPMFRLNSYPRMRLEMGAGGNSVTDVAIERGSTGGFDFFTNNINRGGFNNQGDLVLNGTVNASSATLDTQLTTLGQVKTAYGSGTVNTIQMVTSAGVLGDSPIKKVGSTVEVSTTTVLKSPNIAAGTTGLNALTPISVLGGKGGDNINTTGTVTAGNAANIDIKSGAGGDIFGVTGTGFSGKGGDIKILAGDGGLVTGTGTKFQGAGGGAILQAGTSYGQPGNAEVKAGNCNTVGGKGGDLFMTIGWGNNSSVDNSLYNGALYLGVSASGTVRGNTVVGNTVDDGVNRFQVNGTAKAAQYNLSDLNTAPASATATGTLGEIRVTSTYIYICTATNTWVRTALTSW
jgi:hypothetical protein